MAAGAVTISDVHQLGAWPYELGKVAVLAKITGSSGYATNGDTLAGRVTLGLGRVTGMVVVGAATSDTHFKINGITVAAPVKGYKTDLAGTQAAPKIKFSKGDVTVAEETAAVDVSTHIFWAIFIGEPQV